MTLILFDFDGVLADSLGDMIHFAQQTCDELNINHVVTPDDLDSLDTMAMVDYGRQLEVPEQLLDEFIQRTLRRFIDKKTPADIFQGMDQVVRNLSANHALAVVTGNTIKNVEMFLARHGLDGCVSAIFGVDLPGSKAEMMVRARSQFAAANEAVFMVGDAASDVRAAKELGIKSIAVGWGHQTSETLLRAEPDFFVRSPGELLEVILSQQRPMIGS